MLYLPKYDVRIEVVVIEKESWCDLGFNELLMLKWEVDEEEAEEER